MIAEPATGPRTRVGTASTTASTVAAGGRRAAPTRVAAGSVGAATALAHHPLDERAPRRPAPGERPDLRVVGDGRLSRRARRRRTRLVVIVASIFATACLFGVVAFHAMLIAGQMRLDRLDAEVAEEQARYQRNRLQVAELEAPERIVAVAQERLGMVPPDAVTYLAPSSAAAEEVRAAAAPAADVDVDVDADVEQRGRSGPSTWASVKPYLGSSR